MAILLWSCSLVLAALMFAALGGGRPTRARSRAAMPAAVIIPVEPARPARPNPRPALQTSAALLAIALALDVSAPQARAAPAEPGIFYSAAAVEEALVFGSEPEPWIAVEPAADWVFKAVGVTDGWFV